MMSICLSGTVTNGGGERHEGYRVSSRRPILRQGLIAKSELAKADLIALTMSALCEVVWVLSRGYHRGSDEIATMLRRLINVANVALDREAAHAGLIFLEAGGDFANGVIAYKGRQLGGEVFVSFDKKATKLLKDRGGLVRLI